MVYFINLLTVIHTKGKECFPCELEFYLVFHPLFQFYWKFEAWFLTSNIFAVHSAAAAAAKSLQSSLTLCDPVDGSPPGSPVPGILQARTLEWVAISSLGQIIQAEQQACYVLIHIVDKNAELESWMHYGIFVLLVVK